MSNPSLHPSVIAFEKERQALCDRINKLWQAGYRLKTSERKNKFKIK